MRNTMNQLGLTPFRTGSSLVKLHNTWSRGGCINQGWKTAIEMTFAIWIYLAISKIFFMQFQKVIPRVRVHFQPVFEMTVHQNRVWALTHNQLTRCQRTRIGYFEIWNNSCISINFAYLREIWPTLILSNWYLSTNFFGKGSDISFTS